MKRKHQYDGWSLFEGKKSSHRFPLLYLFIFYALLKNEIAVLVVGTKFVWEYLYSNSSS